MALGNLGMAEQGCSAYRPSTRREKQLERLQLAEGIRQHLFGSKPEVEIDPLVELDKAYQRLESSMGRMLQVHRGLSIPQAKQNYEQRREEDDDQVNLVDERFNHSWAPIGHGPKLGWYWIPKETMSLDTYYPARPAEATRFGHLAKSSTCPFVSLF